MSVIERKKNLKSYNGTQLRAAATVASTTSSTADEIDMTGVHPLRIDEIRKRVIEVRSYLAIEHPIDHDRQIHAQRLGLSVNQLLALVRAWKEHDTALAMSGSGARRGAQRINGVRNLPTESIEAARSILAALGLDTPHVDAVKAVQTRCASLGVKAPSRSTIWNIAMALRRDTVKSATAGRIVVSQCNVKMPVRPLDRIEFPAIILMVDSANGVVLAAAMGGADAVEPTIAAAMGTLDPDRELLIDAAIAAGMESGTLRPHHRIPPAAARTATARAIGRGIGSIDLIYQLTRAVRPEQVLRSRKDRPAVLRDAQRLIAGQLEQHNAARGAPAPLVSWTT